VALVIAPVIDGRVRWDRAEKLVHQLELVDVQPTTLVRATANEPLEVEDFDWDTVDG
jgi:hypothetical protein